VALAVPTLSTLAMLFAAIRVSTAALKRPTLVPPLVEVFCHTILIIFFLFDLLPSVNCCIS
jgi:hypothetical protein